MKPRMTRRRSLLTALMLVALLTGCPHNPDRVSQAGAVAQAGDVAHVRKPPPPKSGPLPPQRVDEPVTADAPPPQLTH